jgi:broad specificity phosphatase PhoE
MSSPAMPGRDPAVRALRPPAIFIVVLAAMLAACAYRPPVVHPAFVILRHAEKQDDGTRDPPLSSAGETRAAQVAARLRALPLRRAWASQYLRTVHTAAPAAAARALAVERYDAATPAAEFARRLVATHPGGTVLVVGHSNTVPDLVAVLCGCAVAPLQETDYDRWYELHSAGDDRFELREARF